MDAVIRAEGVGKRYLLGGHDPGLLTERVLRGGRRRADDDARPSGDRYHWALRDINLEVGQGEVVGLIGANGAGKSTLLKLLASIAYPTEGRLTVRGRLGTLLEVGTGFHPELSGRENVYLSGTILGMKRKEIHARYEEIVAFSGIEEFIETPVKYYSSGMYMRLGFSVAAHLTNEILLVDEVLAVGDADFQRKCQAKIRSIVRDGRTIFFVSHSMEAVRRVCDRIYWLDGGRIVRQGKTDEVIAEYLERGDAVQAGGAVDVPADADRRGTGGARITRVELRGQDGEPSDHLGIGEAIEIVLHVEADAEVPELLCEVGISSADGIRVVTAMNVGANRTEDLRLPAGRSLLRARMRSPLLPGDYVLDVGVNHQRDGVTVDYLDRILTFLVERENRDAADEFPLHSVRGAVRAPVAWEVLDEGSRSPRAH